MASEINYESIDNAYPVAGQDNDSQGFRDNFSVIKNSLQAAKSELEDLQSKALLKSALTGTALTNNLAGNDIIQANFINCTLKTSDSTITQTPAPIDVTQAGYYKLQIANNTTLIFTEWPNDGNLTTLRLELYNNGSNKTVFFSAGPGTMYYDSNFASARSLILDSQSEPYIIEVWSSDGGQSVFIRLLGQFTQ